VGIAAIVALLAMGACGPRDRTEEPRVGDSEEATAPKAWQTPPAPVALTEETRVQGPHEGPSPICRDHIGMSPQDYPGPAPLLVAAGGSSQFDSRLEVFGSAAEVACAAVAEIEQNGRSAALALSADALHYDELVRLVDLGIELLLLEPGATEPDLVALDAAMRDAQTYARQHRRLLHFGWVWSGSFALEHLWRMPRQIDVVVASDALARDLGAEDWSQIAKLIRASGRRVVLKSDLTPPDSGESLRRVLLEGGGLWLAGESLQPGEETLELLAFARRFQHTQDGGAASVAIYVSKAVWSYPDADAYRRAVLDHARHLTQAHVPFRFFVHGRRAEAPYEHGSWAEYVDVVLLPASASLPADEIEKARWPSPDKVIFAGVDPGGSAVADLVAGRALLPASGSQLLTGLTRDPSVNAQYLHLLSATSAGRVEVSLPYYPSRGTPPLVAELWREGESAPRQMTGNVSAEPGGAAAVLQVEVPVEAGWSILATRPAVSSQPERFGQEKLRLTGCGSACLAIGIPGFPTDTRMELAIPEYFEDDDGVTSGWEPPAYAWTWSSDLASLQGGAVTGDVVVRFTAEAAADAVVTTTTVRNLSARPLRALRALYCLRSTGASLFPDSSQERTWVRVAGAAGPLPPVADAGHCHYLEWGGADVHATVLEDTVGRWAVGIVFDEGEIVGGNALASGVCIHAQPLFGDIPPGGTATTQGQVYVGASGARALWERIEAQHGPYETSNRHWITPAPPQCAALAD